MMPSCKMNETKLEVNENYEEADLSDVDDDVFVRSGGRNGYCLEYDIAKKPLMTPRKKSYGFDSIKNGGLHTEVRSTPPAFKVLCMPMCYIMIATFAMLGLVAVITFLTNYVSWPLSVLNLWTKPPKRLDAFGLRSCDKIHVEDVWVQQFPKLLTESAFRLLDVNNDTVDDIVFGYATGADGYGVQDFVCDIYFAGQTPCFGGVLALDGRDGSELWRHWTAHEVYAINCNEDITGDSIRDCLVAGRAGVFCAISGKDGTEIWAFEKGPAKNPIMNIYTAQFIRDLNNDGIVDILAVHGGDPLAEPGSLHRLSGRLVILSGKTGEVLQWVEVPDSKESYYSPQILTRADGTDYVLFGTGGETHGGGLYIISLTDLYNGAIKNAKLIYRDEAKGVMVPPVITDITGDGVDDVVMAMFNSTVIAFEGNTFQQLWNHSIPSSETYTSPTPGFFNEDEVPDFLVKYQTGPGFPVYYHAQTTILDGKTGLPLLDNPIIDTIGSQASTPLIRTEGYGNDIFVYWTSNCKGFEGNSSEFAFKKGTNVHEQSRSDLCKLRFGSKLVNQLRAFNRLTVGSGFVLYDSEERESSEYNNTVDTSQQGQSYLQLHPEMWQYFDQQQQQQQEQSSSQQSYKLMGGQDVPDTIPSYPASAMMPGAVSSGNVYGYPLGVASNIYDLSSQPEMTEEMKYPMYHTVRKHGNYGNIGGIVGTSTGGGGGVVLPPVPVVPVSDAEVAVGMSNGNGDGLRGNLNINLNRRQYPEFTDSKNQHHRLNEVGGIGGDEGLSSPNRIGPNGMDGLGDISGSSLGDTPDARLTSRKSGELSPAEEIWGNYYRTGVGGDNPNDAIADDTLLENRGKYLAVANDPYEKRSGGRRGSGVTHHMPSNLGVRMDNTGGSSLSRNSRAEMFSGNSYMDALRPLSVLQHDIDQARLLEEERLLLQSQRANNNHHPHQPNMGPPNSYWDQRSFGMQFGKRSLQKGSARRKRHIGPHDGGIQRLISTGTLAKTLNGSGGIDLVFATYWFFPARTQIISAKSKLCIEEKMSVEKQRFEETKKEKVAHKSQPAKRSTVDCSEEKIKDEKEKAMKPKGIHKHFVIVTIGSRKDSKEDTQSGSFELGEDDFFEETTFQQNPQADPGESFNNASVKDQTYTATTGTPRTSKDESAPRKGTDPIIRDVPWQFREESPGPASGSPRHSNGTQSSGRRSNPLERPQSSPEDKKINEQTKKLSTDSGQTGRGSKSEKSPGTPPVISSIPQSPRTSLNAKDNTGPPISQKDVPGLNGFQGETDKPERLPETPQTVNESVCTDFCSACCNKSVGTDTCRSDKPPWTSSYRGVSQNSKCRAHYFNQRVEEYLSSRQRPCTNKVTTIIVDDKGHLLPPLKHADLQKRPLWGYPTTQWAIDEALGKHAYKPPPTIPPDTPMPSFFQPLPQSLDVVCDEKKEKGGRRVQILACRSPFCPRKVLRAVHRDFRGKRPRPSRITELRKPPEDPFIKKLMAELQLVFDKFLARKVPIIWIYGRPMKSIAAIRRRHCIQLAETHGFTYLSLDEEVARLAAKGSRAIRAGNPFFEGFSAAERLAIPVCFKLVQDKAYSLNRLETLEMLKFLMLQYFPTNGYVIDGFPWDDEDNEDFEGAFYPIACGLYFLDAQWTTDKSEQPPVVPPLYFKRKVKYNENQVEEACGNFGLKTLKIINAESLDEETSFAVHAVVDEYLDAYDEVLEGNEDVLRDNNLELQTFGETVGYGLDLEKYVKKPKREEVALSPDGKGQGAQHFLELKPLQEVGWEGSRGKGKYTSALFETTPVKVTPSQRRFHSVPENTTEVKPTEGEDKKGEAEETKVCSENEGGVCEEKRHKKSRRRRRCCKCRCKCHRRNRRKRTSKTEEESEEMSDESPPRRRHRHHRHRRHRRRSRDYDEAEGVGGDGDGGRRSHKSRGRRRGSSPRSSSQPDEDLPPEGPYVYDKRWGYSSTRRTGKHPDIRIPQLYTPNIHTDFRDREGEIEDRTKEGTGVYALPHAQSHQIPDPYSTVQHRPGDKPGDYLHDFPGPSAADRFSKINRKELSTKDSRMGLAPKPTTPYAEEPASGLRSLFSDTMSRIIAKNQADIRKIKYDKLKQKVAQVEYEIYQDDYRLPKYRFYKTYKDYTPEDFVKERQNWVPCAECFDSFKQADAFDKGEQLITLSHIKHERHEAEEEYEHQHGKGPLFNRIISCLCGEDNEAGYHIPGFQQERKRVDNTDIEQFNAPPNYKKRKDNPS